MSESKQPEAPERSHICADGKRRGWGRRFRPGQSGNPGGQPKGLADVKAAAREHTAEAIATLVRLMRRGKSEQARIAAARELLDRGYGRPAQALTGEDGTPLLPTIVTHRIEAAVTQGGENAGDCV